MATVLLRGPLCLTALSAPLVVLEVMDLLILGVGSANCLLPVSHAVLKEYVRCLCPAGAAADSRRDTLRAMAKAWPRVHVCTVRLVRYLSLRMLPMGCLSGSRWASLIGDIRGGGLSNSKFQ